MEAQVTIVVGPRDQFAHTQTSLERLYEHTDRPFDLVYVDGNSPRKVARYLRTAAAHYGFTLIRRDRYLSPNEAKNLALPLAKTPFVAFVDNDLIVTAGWLEALLRCAEETGAWVVGPLYFEGDLGDEIIHMAGGDFELSGDPGHRKLVTKHRQQHVRLSDATAMQRERVGFVEFHCFLVRRDALGEIGPFNEALPATRDGLDFAMRIHAAGGQVWFDPAASVTFMRPPPVALRDIPYYWLRWSEAWGRASLEHFCETYGLDPEYTKRITILRSRRQAVFQGVYAATRRMLGRRAERALRKGISRIEPTVNRAFVRALVRDGELSPRPSASSPLPSPQG